MDNISGFKVVINNNLVTPPKIILKQKLQRILTEGGRGDVVDSFHEWSRKFFGGKPPFLVDEVEKTVYTNDAGLALMRRHAEQTL